jgi:glucose-6-phosphate 1-epimerase
MELSIQNTGAAPVTFEEALHTYLAVSDVRQARVEGLSGRDYLDKVDGMKRKTQSGPITITGETDRVYLDTPDTVTIQDPAAGRRITVSKERSASTVVWNPWLEKSKKMPDFGDYEWPRMLCVETANVAENALTLAPGARHVMRATVSAG